MSGRKTTTKQPGYTCIIRPGYSDSDNVRSVPDFYSHGLPLKSRMIQNYGNTKSMQERSHFEDGESNNIDDSDERLILPLNLAEPPNAYFGYRRMCQLDFDDLRFLYTTSLNKPVMIENRVIPAVVVRVWSRSSGKYIRLLDGTAELYGRSVFGLSGHFKMLFVDPTVIMLQSTSHSQRFLMIKDGKIMGKGRGGKESEFYVRQNQNGYCTFESVQHPGHFLGVRSNGNIMRPSQVQFDDAHAHFVVQKEAMDICKLKSKFEL
ncbi:uncharacterized protein LOC144439011 [Glandiceps talaboti]